MTFGNHVDSAIRAHEPTGAHPHRHLGDAVPHRTRTTTTAASSLVEDTYGVHAVKLPAGDMVLYPATSLHRVAPITRGARVSSFFWIQSMVRDDAQRHCCSTSTWRSCA